MPAFDSGHVRIFWHILFEAAARFDENLEDRKIVIISPWISDITTYNSGWSDSAISSAFKRESGGNFESLSDVLAKLQRIGYEITVCTLSTTGKWLPKAKNRHLRRERDFMKKCRNNGINCLIRNNVHKKHIKTPFATISGSLNFSFNGLTGRTQETASYFVKSVHEQDYRQRKNLIHNSLDGARDYDSNIAYIADWKCDAFTNYSSAIPISKKLVSKKIPYPSVSNDEYPEMTPKDYITPGNIGTEIGEKEKNSMKAQILNLIQRTATWALYLISDETLEGMTRDEILSKFMPISPDDEFSDNDVEKIPDIGEIRKLLLSNDENMQNHIKSRLGVISNGWSEWKERTENLINGLEQISTIFANEIQLTKEHADLISELTYLFDEHT
jgi:hypothetical protein